MMMQSTGREMSARPWRLATLVPAMALLSSCGFSFSFLPGADEPYRTELANWQQEQLLEAPLGAMPQEIADDLPDEYLADAGRFLTRTLEPAPDGAARRWQSSDRTAALTVQAVSTDMTGKTICRTAIVSSEFAGAGRDYNLRSCRKANGTWAR
ncbi:MAG: hypothetical protein IMF05_13645 [Proteobacteria bacterium]|nr:hypothetical protein [Pseudomonadota bacterium]